jgi:hypothetical protein
MKLRTGWILFALAIAAAVAGTAVLVHDGLSPTETGSAEAL